MITNIIDILHPNTNCHAYVVQDFNNNNWDLIVSEQPLTKLVLFDFIINYLELPWFIPLDKYEEDYEDGFKINSLSSFNFNHSKHSLDDFQPINNSQGNELVNYYLSFNKDINFKLAKIIHFNNIYLLTKPVKQDWYLIEKKTQLSVDENNSIFKQVMKNIKEDN